MVQYRIKEPASNDTERSPSPITREAPYVRLLKPEEADTECGRVYMLSELPSVIGENSWIRRSLEFAKHCVGSVNHISI